MNGKLKYSRPRIKTMHAVSASPLCLSIPADSRKKDGQGWAKKEDFGEDDEEEKTDFPTSLPLWD